VVGVWIAAKAAGFDWEPRGSPTARWNEPVSVAPGGAFAFPEAPAERAAVGLQWPIPGQRAEHPRRE